MYEAILIVISLIVIGLTNLYTFNKAYKKGSLDLMLLILASGYDSRVKGFESLNTYAKKGGIVFVGDSITQDYNVYEYFPDLLVYNRGIGGDTTVGLEKRLEASVFSLDPSMVVMLMGTNDFGVLESKVEAVFERIKRIVMMIKERKKEIKILLLSVYPVNETLDTRTVQPRKNSDIQALNQKLMTLEDVLYLDLYSKLADEHGRLKEAYTVEGLHISPLGYELITKELMAVLTQSK
ncbi:MAG: lysophospholipase [Acholeplasmataceae bacterium]|nr:lysophospholipase [Acholeplasmataceae bacterium]